MSMPALSVLLSASYVKTGDIELSAVLCLSANIVNNKDISGLNVHCLRNSSLKLNLSFNFKIIFHFFNDKSRKCPLRKWLTMYLDSGVSCNH